MKKGITLANQNVPLILLRMAVSVLKLLSLLVFMAVPLLIAVFVLGFDLARARDIIPFVTDKPFDIAVRHLGPLMLFLGALAMYGILSFLIRVYVMAGTLGTLKNSAVEKGYRFSLGDFFRSASSGFSNMLWLFIVMSLAALVLALVVITAGGIITVVLRAGFSQDSVIALFLLSFGMMTLTVFSIILLSGGGALTAYAAVIVIVEGAGPVESVQRAFAFMKDNPRALWFVLIVLCAVAASYGLILTVQISLHVIPFIIPLIYLFNSFLQNYCILFAWSSILACYLDIRGGRNDDQGDDVVYEI